MDEVPFFHSEVKMSLYLSYAFDMDADEASNSVLVSSPAGVNHSESLSYDALSSEMSYPSIDSLSHNTLESVLEPLDCVLVGDFVLVSNP